MNEDSRECLCVRHFFQLSTETAFAFVLLSKTSVEAAPFTDTHTKFSEYGKRQNYASERLRQLAVGLFQLNGWRGRSSFPKFTL